MVFTYQIDSFQKLSEKFTDGMLSMHLNMNNVGNKLSDLIDETKLNIDDTIKILKSKKYYRNASATIRKQMQYQFVKDKAIVDHRKDEEEKYQKKNQEFYFFKKEDNIDKIKPKYKYINNKTKILIIPKEIKIGLGTQFYEDPKYVPATFREFATNVMSGNRINLKDKKNFLFTFFNPFIALLFLISIFSKL